MNIADQEDESLKAVFEICEPRPLDRKISLKRLQSLFEEHAHMPSSEFMDDDGSNQWISFDEFRDGITNFVDKISSQVQEEQNWESRGEVIQKSGEEDHFSSLETSNRLPSNKHHLTNQDLLLIPDLVGDISNLEGNSNYQPSTIKPSSLQNIPLLTQGSSLGRSTEPLKEASPEAQLRDFFGSPITNSSITNSMTDMSEALEHSSSSQSTVMNSPERMATFSPQSEHGSQSPVMSLTDSALGGSTSPDVQIKSNCSSLSDRDEENFESYGENDNVEFDDSELVDFDEIDSSRVEKSSPVFKRNIGRRHSWMRTSLRRTPSASTTEHLVPPKRWGSFRHPKRVGSNALASALYHNGSTSFNSSGRSSNCDEGDIQSDISLEDDVNDLNQKVQMLQEQVGHLAESQATTDDKYSKVKQDNTSLIARIHMLEENIRELELRSDERLDEEQKRNKELLARLEREKHLEIENHTLRLQTLEKENGKLHQETANLRSTLEKIKLEKRTTEDYLLDAQNSLTQLQDEHNGVLEARKRDQDAFEVERGQSKHLINELTKEVEILSTRTSHHVGVVNGKGGQIIEDDPLEVMPSRIKELESEIRNLREDRRHLEEKNEELMGQILNKGLEEGKSILISTDASKPSIDHEIQEMSDNQIRTALKEQKDVNFQLRNYIDGILMNIIEKYPELLEVRK
ncbi:rab11 family-interacting protein 4B-like isoform X2 [Tigriopus californicus]|uniref:rab11 family-interacting protein 4B-like isoform X2 n=1 Tax=Tigriopus californicus TaxID=6832 RepID=UPI0027D9FE75|nr:rab11 family-interacting protein 4B-like isoform X2 [Tigriopus californicus]